MNDRTRNIGVIFTADTDSLTRGYSVAQAATMSFAKTVESQMWGATAATKGLSEAFSQFDMTSVSSIQKMLTTGVVGYSAFSVLKTIGQNTINLQNEQAQLAQVLESTGRAASMTVDELNEMGAAMARASAFSSGEMTQAQYTLLAFTGIAKSEFPRAMQAAADMAARTGMTIKSAAETVGRALDVPSQGLASLTRQGFRFTEEQKKLAQHLEATGRTAEAQAIIFDALEESYKGAAQAARDTFGGAWSSLLNTVGDLATGSDGFFAPITASLNALNDVLSSGEAEAAIRGLTAGAQLLAAVLAGRLVVSLGMSIGAMLASTAETYRYQIALAGMSGVSKTAAISVTSLGVAARTAGAAMSLLLGPVGIVASLAASAAIAVYGYRDSAKDAASASAELAEKTDWLNASFEGMTKNQAAAALQELQQEYASAQVKALDAEGAVSLLTNRLKLYPDHEKAAEWNRELIKQKGIVDDAAQSIGKLFGQIQILNEIISAPEGIQSLSGEYLKFEASIDRQIALMGKSGQAAQLRYDLEHGSLSKLSAEEKKLAEQRINALDKAEKAEEARRKSLRDAGSRTKELENLIKRLTEQHAVLGMTADEAERYRITTAAGSAADRERALVLFDQIQSWKEADKAIKQAQESSKIFAATQRELDLFSQSFDIEIAGLGLGDRARELLEKENEIRRDFAERRRKLEEEQQSELTKLDAAAYAERIKLLEATEEKKVQILQQKSEEKIAAENDWLNGVSRAFSNYVDKAQDMAGQADSAFSDLFDGIGDSATKWAMGMDVNFTDVLRSFTSMLIKMQLQAAASSVFQSMGFGVGLLGGSGNLSGGSLSGATWFGSSSVGGGGLSGLAQLPRREHGGPVSARGMYQVNEAGEPELLTIGNKQLLMMAGQSGHVTPLSQGRGSAPPFTGQAHIAPQVSSLEVVINDYGNNKVTAAEETSRGPDGQMLRRVVVDIIRDEFSSGSTGTGRLFSKVWGAKART